MRPGSTPSRVGSHVHAASRGPGNCAPGNRAALAGSGRHGHRIQGTHGGIEEAIEDTYRQSGYGGKPCCEGLAPKALHRNLRRPPRTKIFVTFRGASLPAGQSSNTMANGPASPGPALNYSWALGYSFRARAGKLNYGPVSGKPRSSPTLTVRYPRKELCNVRRACMSAW